MGAARRRAELGLMPVKDGRPVSQRLLEAGEDSYLGGFRGDVVTKMARGARAFAAWVCGVKTGTIGRVRG